MKVVDVWLFVLETRRAVIAAGRDGTLLKGRVDAGGLETRSRGLRRRPAL